VLISFIFGIIALILGYLCSVSNSELKELQKYAATLENDLLQQQIKFEEVSQQSQHDHINSLGSQLSVSDSELTADPLTNLPSIVVFEDRMLQTLNLSKRFGRTFGLLLLEVTGLNELSEKISEEDSHKLFKELAHSLSGTIRKIDTVSRSKNNIFLFLLPQLTQPETAAFVVNRLLKSLEKPIMLNDQLINLELNFGISIFPNDGDTVSAMLDNANQALEQSKSTSGNSFRFHNKDIQEKSNRMNELSQLFQKPLFLNEFLVYSESQMNTKTAQIEGVKIWPFLQDSKYGLIRFDELQAIADRENKTSMIMIWLIEKLIAQYQLWSKRGFTPKRFCISISIRQIQNNEFLAQLQTLLKNTNFDPKLLAFEIDAKNFADNAASLQTAFTNLSDLGIQIAISVYSLGHLALQKITQLPISYLKVDSRLIKNLMNFADDERILAALLDLSRTMDLKIIVEGVDEEKQKMILKKIGFGIMEGKLFGLSKPLEFFMS
jgi:diguanylate cyclase (GGDEF)-like protein